MARMFGKRTLRIHPQLIRLAFFILWHGSRGRIPASRGSWKAYSYPINVDGSKLTETYGYRTVWARSTPSRKTPGAMPNRAPPSKAGFESRCPLGTN